MVKRSDLLATTGVVLIAAGVGLLTAWPAALLVIGIAFLIGAVVGDAA